MEQKLILDAIAQNILISPKFDGDVERAIGEGLAERVEILQLTEKGEAVLAASDPGRPLLPHGSGP